MTMEETVKKPWYRGLAFRLSLRALIVLVLLIGGGLGWIAHRARVRRDAVAAIERAGGKVYYPWEWVESIDGRPTMDPKPGPKWLVDAVGVDYLANVAAVQLIGGQGDKASDALMAGVCDFIISNAPMPFVLTAPLVTIVEAKNDNLPRGYGQCIASIVAADLFNQEAGRPIPVIHGVATTGSAWKFLRLRTRPSPSTSRNITSTTPARSSGFSSCY